MGAGDGATAAWRAGRDHTRHADQTGVGRPWRSATLPATGQPGRRAPACSWVCQPPWRWAAQCRQSLLLQRRHQSAAMKKVRAAAAYQCPFLATASSRVCPEVAGRPADADCLHRSGGVACSKLGGEAGSRCRGGSGGGGGGGATTRLSPRYNVGYPRETPFMGPQWCERPTTSCVGDPTCRCRPPPLRNLFVALLVGERERRVCAFFAAFRGMG